MTKEIQKAVGRNRVIAGHKLVAENIKYILNHEMDVMSVRSGKLYEYEVKISRSDFLADKKKRKQKFNGTNGLMVDKWNANFFSYVCPTGLIKMNEIPDFAGLYYYADEMIWEQRKPKIHSQHQHDMDLIIKKVINVYQERAFFDGVCLMTYKNREDVKFYEKHYGLNNEPNAQESDTTEAK